MRGDHYLTFFWNSCFGDEDTPAATAVVDNSGDVEQYSQLYATVDEQELNIRDGYFTPFAETDDNVANVLSPVEAHLIEESQSHSIEEHHELDNELSQSPTDKIKNLLIAANITCGVDMISLRKLKGDMISLRKLKGDLSDYKNSEELKQLSNDKIDQIISAIESALEYLAELSLRKISAAEGNSTSDRWNAAGKRKQLFSPLMSQALRVAGCSQDKDRSQLTSTAPIDIKEVANDSTARGTTNSDCSVFGTSPHPRSSSRCRRQDMKKVSPTSSPAISAVNSGEVATGQIYQAKTPHNTPEFTPVPVKWPKLPIAIKVPTAEQHRENISNKEERNNSLLTRMFKRLNKTSYAEFQRKLENNERVITLPDEVPEKTATPRLTG